MQQLQEMAKDLKKTLTRFQVPQNRAETPTAKTINASQESSPGLKEGGTLPKQLLDFSKILQQEAQDQGREHRTNPPLSYSNPETGINQPSS